MCHLLNSKTRCNRNFLNISSTIPALVPGSLNSMFERITQSGISKSNGYGAVEILSRSPWIITIDKFISDKEIDAILKSATKWERSTDTGKSNEYGETGKLLSSLRTSSNSWCRERCERKPLVADTFNRIEKLINIPKENFEMYQILKYEKGQYYSAHHDSSTHQDNFPSGKRILTIFIYLSDVIEGGETAFTNLNITVRPKKGMALIWPSVLDDNPNEIDWRTIHEALPVVRGVKLAANSWIRQYNFRIPLKWACTGGME
jgi:prolyl 4-hydroxylase